MKAFSPKLIIAALALLIAIVSYHVVNAKVQKLHKRFELAIPFNKVPEKEPSDWDKKALEAVNPKNNHRWVGREMPIPREIVDAAGADSYFSRQYKDRQIQNSFLGAYVAYSESFAVGSNTGALHYPELCFEGSGAKLLGKQEGVQIEIPGYMDGKISVTVYLFLELATDRDGQTMHRKRLVVYWMENGDRIIGDRLSGRIGTFWKTLTGGRLGYLAQIRLDTYLRPLRKENRFETEEEAKERLVEFSRSFLPNVMAKHLPKIEDS